MKNGRIMIVCDREHLDGFARYVELAETIEKWLEETGYGWSMILTGINAPSG